MDNLKTTFKNIKSIFKTKITDENIGIFVKLYISGNKSKLPKDLQKKDIGKWNVKDVTNMTSLFENATTFDESLNNWDVSNVTSMEKMFKGATTLNQSFDNWNIANVRNMSQMFEGCTNLTANFNSWIPSPGTNIQNMFTRTGITIFPIWYPITISPQQNRQQNRRAIAYHIHDEFKNVKINELMKIIKPIVSKSDKEYAIVEWEFFMYNLKNKMKKFIKTNFKSNKEEYSSSLNNIIKKASKESQYSTNEMKIYLGNTIDFIFMQPDSIIETYIEIFIEECQTAYGDILQIKSKNMDERNVSCIKGIIERIFMTLKTALVINCLNSGEDCKPEYKKILFKVFSINVKKMAGLDKNELTQKWNEEFLENSEFLNENNLNEESARRKSLTSRNNFLKNHYINFMKNIYTEEDLYNNQIEEMIKTEAENLENAGVFKNMYFGGTRASAKRKTLKNIRHNKYKKTCKK